ncbi:MAG: methyltransferase domain-containing protein [Saprospiraceae bacterium]|nr:methyltransferase domain-containing protein [Saprospiraceae bacterium]
MDKIQFLREGIRNIRTVGTITRSSRFLCSKVLSLSNLNDSKCIVELGAGDGVMTKYILRAMPSDAILFAFEINPKFCQILRIIKDPRLHVIEDSAENLEHHLDKHGFKQIDTVFSALPFVMLPDHVSNAIVASCHRFLKPLGQYLQIHYSLLEKNLYKSIFGHVDITFHLLNIPPAFILACYKAA